jgi:hypothetical protein
MGCPLRDPDRPCGQGTKERHGSALTATYAAAICYVRSTSEPAGGSTACTKLRDDPIASRPSRIDCRGGDAVAAKA